MNSTVNMTIKIIMTVKKLNSMIITMVRFANQTIAIISICTSASNNVILALHTSSKYNGPLCISNIYSGEPVANFFSWLHENESTSPTVTCI